VKKLSFKSADQKIWFISDLHLGHDKDFILNPRGYANVDEALTHQWLMLNEYIGSNDIVFNLGDMVIGAMDRAREYASRVVHMNCKHQYFIWGNHNAGVRQLYDDCRKYLGLLTNDVEIYPLNYPNSNFTFLGHYAEISIDGRAVVLTHYPIASWNHIAKGAYHIHGHCHRNLKEDLTLNRLDVGWEWKRRPIEWKEIIRELSPRNATAPDHHKKEIIT
jgi:calcineurin-like phosphoesterase family protein